MSAGIFVSGWMIDRFTRRSKQAYAIVPAISLVLAIPFYVGFVWAPDWQTALLFLIGPTFLNYFYLSSAVTLVQQEVRPDQRVMSGALLLLVMNLIGLGLGPTYVGAASDFFRAYSPGSLAADRLVHAHAVLRSRDLSLHQVGARASQRGRQSRRSRSMMFASSSDSPWSPPRPLWSRASRRRSRRRRSDRDCRLPARLKAQTKARCNVFKGIPYATPPVGNGRWRRAGADGAVDRRQTRDGVRAWLHAAGVAGSRPSTRRSSAQ